MKSAVYPVNKTDIYSRSLLAHACAWKFDKDSIVWLLDQGADPNQHDHTAGNTPTHLYLHVKYADISVLEKFVEKNADFDRLNDAGLTPLFYAITRQNLEVVKFLLDNGANNLMCDLSKMELSDDLKSLLSKY